MIRNGNPERGIAKRLAAHQRRAVPTAPHELGKGTTESNLSSNGAWLLSLAVGGSGQKMLEHCENTLSHKSCFASTRQSQVALLVGSWEVWGVAGT